MIMNESRYFLLPQEKFQRYLIQPDQATNFHAQYKGTFEHASYLANSSVRFWLNNETIDFPMHWQDSTELIMPLENNYSVEIDSRHYTLSPGDILIIPAGSLHKLCAPFYGSRFIFLFDLKILSKLLGYTGILSRLLQPVFLPKNGNTSFYQTEYELILKMAELYWGGSPAKILRIYSCLLDFFSVYSEAFYENNGFFSMESYRDKERLFHQLNDAFDYLELHYTENVTLEETAASVGFSRFYFSRLFKQYMNQTFYEYLTDRRIRAAKELLMDYTLSITDIALCVGFNTSSSFNRAFKRVTGYTPSAYRNMGKPNGMISNTDDEVFT